MDKRIAFLFAPAFALLLCLAACQTVPKSVPESLSAREIIQKAQEASDAGNYKAATFYYETCKERFSDDLSVVCACEYELAFISYKANRNAEAVERFEALLERYASPDAALLPQEYKILSEKILPKARARIERKERKDATGK